MIWLIPYSRRSCGSLARVQCRRQDILRLSSRWWISSSSGARNLNLQPSSSSEHRLFARRHHSRWHSTEISIRASRSLSLWYHCRSGRTSISERTSRRSSRLFIWNLLSSRTRHSSRRHSINERRCHISHASENLRFGSSSFFRSLQSFSRANESWLYCSGKAQTWWAQHENGRRL